MILKLCIFIPFLSKCQDLLLISREWKSNICPFLQKFEKRNLTPQKSANMKTAKIPACTFWNTLQRTHETNISFPSVVDSYIFMFYLKIGCIFYNIWDFLYFSPLFAIYPRVSLCLIMFNLIKCQQLGIEKPTVCRGWSTPLPFPSPPSWDPPFQGNMHPPFMTPHSRSRITDRANQSAVWVYYEHEGKSE